MLPPVTTPRARAREVAGAVVAGVILVFGGTCGVGPTSLSRLAVSANQTSVPDDTRAQAPALVAAEPASPVRRVVRRRLRPLARRLLSPLTAPLSHVVATVRSPRAPPPLRGPPLLLG